ncbi:MAG: universal stress protein [Bacteroidetes bacterium]|nr:universal stress protein [Bacteroidota bacterium]
MNTILVATDFSDASLNAVNYAADMASMIHADLFMLHVCEMPIGINEISVIYTESESLPKYEKYMLEQKNKLNTKFGGNLNIGTEVCTGLFFSSLMDVCKRIKPYIVVIGTQGKSAMERFFLGAHAVYSMQHLEWPIMAVPLGAKFSGIKKMAIACDFVHVLETVPIEAIKQLSTDFQAELHIINYGKKDKFDSDVVFQSGLFQELFHKMKPIYHLLNGENIVETVVVFAEQNQVDLLIVFPKSHGFVEQFVHKSSTKEMVLNSHVPIISLHR